MPAALTYPGVYVEELPSGVHTITGVATSITTFIGWAPQGPVDQAVLVESWSEFASQFGNLYSGVYLGYAVNAFFANGGSQAYVIRLVDPTAAAASLDDAIGRPRSMRPTPEPGEQPRGAGRAADGQHDELHSQCHRRAFRECPGKLGEPVPDPVRPAVRGNGDRHGLAIRDVRRRDEPSGPGQSPRRRSPVRRFPRWADWRSQPNPAGRFRRPPPIWYTVTAIYAEGESEPTTPDDSGTTTAWPQRSWPSR